MVKYLKAFIHNAIIHPCMMFMPADLAARVHDKNARWAFGEHRYPEMNLEGYKDDERGRPPEDS